VQHSNSNKKELPFAVYQHKCIKHYKRHNNTPEETKEKKKDTHMYTTKKEEEEKRNFQVIPYFHPYNFKI
jgi:hypothetical protein